MVMLNQQHVIFRQFQLEQQSILVGRLTDGQQVQVQQAEQQLELHYQLIQM